MPTNRKQPRSINRNTPLHCLPTVATVPDLASLTSLPESSIYELIKRGKIPAVKVGRRILIMKATMVIHLITPKPTDGGGL